MIAPEIATSAQCAAPALSDWMTAEEAAGYLRVKPRTLLLWARQGKVRGYQLSGTERHVWRFLRIDLDATMMTPSVVS